MTDDERVRAAAEALRADRLSGSQGSWEELAEIVLEASGYPAEVARLRAEIARMNSEIPTRSDNARLRAKLQRALDALAATVTFMDENFSHSPDFRDAPAFVAARAVLAAHDREYPCD